MFSDSRWGHTYVVSAPVPDGGAARPAPYARPLLSAELPNRATCFDKRLIERLDFLQPVPPAASLCTRHPDMCSFD